MRSGVGNPQSEWRACLAISHLIVTKNTVLVAALDHLGICSECELSLIDWHKAGDTQTKLLI